MFSRCVIMRLDDSALQAVATPLEPRLLSLVRRLLIMSESYHVDQSPFKCITCGKEKPVSDFAKDRTTATGHKSFCRQCDAEKRLRRKEDLLILQSSYWYAYRYSQPALLSDCKECCSCRIEKPLGDFRVYNCHGKAGRAYICRRC